MKVLVACEESQAVCKAFRQKGHEAYSADLQECSGGHPEWHIRGDVLPLIDGNCTFMTDGGQWVHIEGEWDLLIAHPPCTFLTNAGAARLYRVIDGQRFVNWERFRKGMAAREVFMRIMNAECDRIAIENPIPTGIYELPKYTQIIQPYYFGHEYSKKTCLWLKNLPPLTPTELVTPICSWVSGGSKKADGSPRKNKGMTFRDSFTKSKTFPGIAKAMAEQWG